MEKVATSSRRGRIYIGLMLGGTGVWVGQYAAHHASWTGWLSDIGVGNTLARNLTFALFLLGFGLVLELSVQLAWLGTGKLRGDPALKRWMVILIAVAFGVAWITLIPLAWQQLPEWSHHGALPVLFYIVVLYGGLVGIVVATVRVGRSLGVFLMPAGKQHAA